jgi:hypothetical protein
MRGGKFLFLFGAVLCVLLMSSVPAASASDEPRYNLGAAYNEAFPQIEQGASGTSIIYFYSAFGDVPVYVTAAVDSCPNGWRVEFEPENITVVPQWFENKPFQVNENEYCLKLTYGGNVGWVRAYPMTVRITPPADAKPDNYVVKISYVGDFRMEGMSIVKRSGGVEWTVEVGLPPASPLNILPVVLVVAIICVSAAAAVIIIKRRESGWAARETRRLSQKQASGDSP